MSAAAETFPLPQRRRVVGLAYGSMRSVRRGTGSDVVGSRAYVHGDDPRTIDRHASARYSSARGRDDWIVRQTYAEEATRVVVLADRRPSMRLYPDGLPWLSKPRALTATTELVCRSAAVAVCPTGYVDADGEEEPRWLAPGRATQAQIAAAARGGRFTGGADALERGFAHLAFRVRLQAGAFVFVVSDFLGAPSDDVLGDAAGRWEIVPVLVQDPVWERSFPQVAGALLPLADVESGRLRAVRLTRREERERREENELRFAAVLDRFDRFGLDPIVLDSHEPERILDTFRAWSERGGGAGGRL